MSDLVMKADDWMKEEEAIHKKIEELASKSKGFKSLSEDIERDDDNDVKTKCKLTRRVFGESLEMYEEGEMTYQEFIEDFKKSCEAIAKTKPAKFPQEDEADEMESDK